ncbi:metallophosphoesterase family protein [Paenibacillus radicis (ex Xue et al. 2023)]|uniref:Metallophosphoesterase family protein n=1 Tax=Paenibacillus radicis (ex Xue et al. 2023) TaxID=2972489 RepID=A0ABT1Y8Z7_9BACL|nr:metallophosphoesterase family protein [Paenibacillus radicis (ex Xue et al. 2023)]MCR8629666.1 metallophosphoesterase family protein [Paenibacillus radicis (ex Xue et al. 2023)]
MRPGTSLNFRPEGTFTIVQFTDLHWKNGEEPDQRTAKLMQTVLDLEQPDLVFFTGDTIESEHCRNPKQSFHDAVSIVSGRRLPWAAVFGNHDAEYGTTKSELLQVQLEHSTCLSEAGPEELHGIGNYTIPILNGEGKPEVILYALDSGDYAAPLLKGYDWIHRDQIEWFARQADAFAQWNGGQPVPSLAFFHIPVPEYEEMWNKETCFGVKEEGVGCPKVNSGFFTAMLEKGNVMGTFTGHDHINDYHGQWHGIRLCYGRATGFNTYGKETMQRGARVIRLNQGQAGFDTWIRLEDGSRIDNQPEHSPELQATNG